MFVFAATCCKIVSTSIIDYNPYNACRACITAGPTYIITNLKTKTNL